MNKKSRIAVRIALLLVVAYLGLSHYASDVARTRVDAAIAKQGGKFTYKNVSYNLFTQQTVISDISILPPGAMTTSHIDKVVVRRIAGNSSTPSSLAVDIKGLMIDSAIFGEAGAAQLAALGYTGPWPCDMSIDYNCLLDKRELTLQSFYEAKDVGSLRLNLVLGNIDYDGKKPPTTFALALAPNITLLRLELAYVDDSLLERVLKQEAAEKGVDVPTFKTTLADQSEAFLQKKQLPHTASIMTALKQFIENPRQLSISATPATPVSLGEIGSAGSPEAVAKLLNLQVKS